MAKTSPAACSNHSISALLGALAKKVSRSIPLDLFSFRGEDRIGDAVLEVKTGKAAAVKPMATEFLIDNLPFSCNVTVVITNKRDRYARQAVQLNKRALDR